MNNRQTTTLKNGLRIIFEQNNSEVVYCGYVICAGTRHEDAADYGLAHFVEHMTFKGTLRRRSYHINNFLDRVGGELNAFTNKQETVYHATALRQDFHRAADLLTDIVFHSTYPQHEIDKEVEVICDEIESFQDSPAELIFDDFEAMIFKNHPLGRDILGQQERLRRYTTADARRFARYYCPANAAFFVYGNLRFDRVVRLLERLTSDLPAERPIFLPQPLKPYVAEKKTVSKETHQTHVLIGTRAISGEDERRFALLLINNLLGGPGMNSRLNNVLREKSGLVYYVESSLYAYPDTGVWEVYFGCDAKDTDKCCRKLLKEVNRLVEHPLTPAQLSAAKKQMKGQLGISSENSESYALGMGKSFAHYNVHRDLLEVFEDIDAITPEDICRTAAEILSPDRLSTIIYQ